MIEGFEQFSDFFHYIIQNILWVIVVEDEIGQAKRGGLVRLSAFCISIISIINQNSHFLSRRSFLFPKFFKNPPCIRFASAPSGYHGIRLHPVCKRV